MAFMDDQFEFSYGKNPSKLWNEQLIVKDDSFTFDEFMQYATLLQGKLFGITKDITPYIASAKNTKGYEALKKHKNHTSLGDAMAESDGLNSISWNGTEEFTKSNWTKSQLARYTANPYDGTVSLTQDRLDHPEILTFKGECITGSVFDAVMDMFHKDGNLYVLSDSKKRLPKSRSLN